jgi:hypothetical protein
VPEESGKETKVSKARTQNMTSPRRHGRYVSETIKPTHPGWCRPEMFLGLLFAFVFDVVHVGAGIEQAFFLTKGAAASCTDEVPGIGSLGEVEKQCAKDASCDFFASNQSSRTYKKCEPLKRTFVSCNDLGVIRDGHVSMGVIFGGGHTYNTQLYVLR